MIFHTDGMVDNNIFKVLDISFDPNWFPGKPCGVANQGLRNIKLITIILF